MKSKYKLITPMLVMMIAASLKAQPPLQPQVSFAAGSGSVWTASWQGVSQRSYFSQASVDLISWNYLPEIQFGGGLKSMELPTAGAAKFFIRLKFTDDPTTDPEIEDFDLDQIGSLAELRIGHDPFVAEPFLDSDLDGISDDIEKHWFGNLTTMSATSDSDGDGIPDWVEANAGADPTANQSINPAQRTDYQYDTMGRLTRAAGVSYTFDVEGSLETSN